MSTPNLSWAQRDGAVNWHPFTPIKTAGEAVAIVRGEGAYLYDEKGKRYIDAISSWWVNLHGHAHPYIAEQVYEQLRTLEHVIFAGFTHPSAVALSEALLAVLPENQQKVFFSDNGSTAVEVALKMALQYAYNRGEKKTKILAFRQGYHGDTFGAMAVSGRSGWTEPFAELLFDVIHIDLPTAENLPEIHAFIDQHADQIACFVYEPLVLGAGGMIMYEAEHLDALMRYCRSKGILLVQDEIFVGFGRTGRMFAANHLTGQPDIMCLSKGLTGGTMPLGVTTCTEAIHEAFCTDNVYGTLFHGHSFTANSLACRAALASMELLKREETQASIARISRRHEGFRARVATHAKIRSARQCGTILAMNLGSDDKDSYFRNQCKPVFAALLDQGILLRPLGNVLYLVPPYCTSDADLDYIYDAIIGVLG
ncbi:adenosylmethionine-8-amino-7-oxononanoate aminotransferase [Dyadobacter sp. BE34]|uniref:Adenosylmethionine-8-amino-7-oxononanoate aminotransferase n=1 Tax=Dyadobacter fermentans TaxID=94254 RepID=A0ABU1QUZ7_9BACT|nr:MULTISPECIES: adenosylmethionine--8-amino-7-oxononanoate transaminase [Dyadobacter]MDR6804961.1 adenosylmethionine-8-amino-7-oxononanoate aminotransferase [Dyadobacter fermentans]MDR7043280.1 adenosylmethionine-8-amino-7-oxononanoate aminotransferase [Dyadobacter sp. BE242]MDR7197592.1 adenosylmethionine-8-amino-7-oxononanoate aminotransferase [Dyadobacter sp. BE34]MDR7214975.1 adenosylmethionine-8-amino-7-oxononanoate aminotransferase [Dyadobacter sp. BE31]MDR7262510.1 adenosylmethionine-8